MQRSARRRLHLHKLQAACGPVSAYCKLISSGRTCAPVDFASIHFHSTSLDMHVPSAAMLPVWHVLLTAELQQ